MEAGTFLDKVVNSGAYQDCALQAHETWRATKVAQGWSYGEKRDNEQKTNPLMRPFEELPREVQGQNSLTPYAVVNYFRVEHGDSSLGDLGQLLAGMIEGRDQTGLDQVGEYVHSHFLAAQLAKGETVKTRNDMGTYESLTEDQKSWDLASAKEVMNYLRIRIGEQRELERERS